MGLPPDEHLPEVVPDTSPQVVSNVESQYKQRGYDERDKYVVQYDDTPKIPSEMPYVQDHQDYAQQGQHPVSAMSPDSSLPWEPMSAIEETPAGHGGGMGGGMGGAGGEAGHDGMNNEKPEHDRRICGFKRKTFFIALVAALAVIAIAIGGGVGGGLAAGNSRQSSGNPPDESSTSAVSTAPTKTQQSSGTKTISSATSSPSPTFLNNQTNIYPLAFQGFTEPGFDGNYTEIIKTAGFHDLGIDCLSYVWMPNNTGCCVTFCANKTSSVGFHCDPWKREKASTAFPRIYIWCGEDPNKSESTAVCSVP